MCICIHTYDHNMIVILGKPPSLSPDLVASVPQGYQQVGQQRYARVEAIGFLRVDDAVLEAGVYLAEKRHKYIIGTII